MPRPDDNLRSRPIGGRLFFEVKDGAFYSVGCRDVANALLHVLYLAPICSLSLGQCGDVGVEV